MGPGDSEGSVPQAESDPATESDVHLTWLHITDEETEAQREDRRLLRGTSGVLCKTSFYCQEDVRMMRKRIVHDTVSSLVLPWGSRTWAWKAQRGPESGQGWEDGRGQGAGGPTRPGRMWTGTDALLSGQPRKRTVNGAALRWRIAGSPGPWGSAGPSGFPTEASASRFRALGCAWIRELKLECANPCPRARAQVHGPVCERQAGICGPRAPSGCCLNLIRT